MKLFSILVAALLLNSVVPFTVFANTDNSLPAQETSDHLLLAQQPSSPSLWNRFSSWWGERSTFEKAGIIVGAVVLVASSGAAIATYGSAELAAEAATVVEQGEALEASEAGFTLTATAEVNTILAEAEASIGTVEQAASGLFENLNNLEVLSKIAPKAIEGFEKIDTFTKANKIGELAKEIATTQSEVNESLASARAELESVKSSASSVTVDNAKAVTSPIIQTLTKIVDALKDIEARMSIDDPEIKSLLATAAK